MIDLLGRIPAKSNQSRPNRPTMQMHMSRVDNVHRILGANKLSEAK